MSIFDHGPHLFALEAVVLRFHAPSHKQLVAGLDLARRRDHSALVLLDVEPDRLTVSAALRLPQAPLRQQFALVAPHLAGLDLLVFDQSGLGDAAAELLPKTPPHIGVCLVGGDRRLTCSAQGDRLVVGKSWLIQRLGTAMRSGEMIVADRAPGRDLLRKELARFVFKPGTRGRMRLEAARGHDDLVVAAALAVLAVDFVGTM
jgi:phage FluMu gp28-like protein